MEENIQATPAPAEDPHVYKSDYTKAEVNELLAWFEERMDKLPQTLRLNKATTTDNLKRTVKALTTTVKRLEGVINVTYSGYVSHLVLIRLRLQEQGME